MPSVPNWIGHAVVILRRFGTDEAIPVRDWRATRTQVVLTLDNAARSEIRFYLDTMRAVGQGSRAELLDATDPAVVARVARIRAREAVATLETAVALAGFDKVRGDHEATLALVSDLRDKATAAMAALGEVL